VACVMFDCGRFNR